MTRACPVCNEELLDGFDNPRAIYCSDECKYLAANARQRKGPAKHSRHGTRSMYVMGCRQECCLSAQRAYARQRRGTQLPEWYKLWTASDNTNEAASVIVATT